MKRLVPALSVLMISLFAAACNQIDTGNVGVERTLGNVKPVALPPGVYQTLTKTVDEFTAKEIAIPIDNMRPKSSDNLTMQDVDIDVYYRTVAAQIPALFIKYQGDVAKDKNGDMIAAASRVQREAREAVYIAVSKFDATTMHNRRAELSEAIQKELQKGLESSDPGAFVVTTVNVRNLVTDSALEKSIQERAAVDQQIAAKQKQIELARKEAERRKVEAEGEAAANRIIAESVTEGLIKLRQTEAALVAATKTTSVTQINGNASALIQTK
jgi:regulator of protease activity HflC (stomatin/prohibitin superfamily)